MTKTPPAITGSSDEANIFMEFSDRVGSGFGKRSRPTRKTLVPRLQRFNIIGNRALASLRQFTHRTYEAPNARPQHSLS